MAWGAPFQRGDLFAVTGGGVQEYTPTGQLVQTIPGTSGASSLCFDPSGKHLILPGIGLFDNSGNSLASNWASVPVGALGPGVDCVADGFGNVYADGPSSPITKYDLKGNALQAFNVVGGNQFAMGLTPDECTMYISAWGAPPNFSGPVNVCTNTQESANNWSLEDDLGVLPNWQVLLLGDYHASLIDTSGQAVQTYGFSDDGKFRHLAVDPDGTSFWACCVVDFDTNPSPPYVDNVVRFDINSGQILTKWPLSAGAIAVYSPPLVGNADVATTVASNRVGTAEAFLTRVRYSGQLTRIHLYLDSTSAASHVVVGIYSNRDNQPAKLLAGGTVTNGRPGSWNYVDVPSMSVTAGQSYWMAVLAPHGDGTPAFRDRPLTGLAMVSARHNLTSLPAQWSGGEWKLSGSLSAYGS